MTPSGKILLVDDSPEFLEMYRTILATEGHEVDEARDAASVLAKLEKPGWDLVLLDRKLQGPAGPDTGLDLMQAIRERAQVGNLYVNRNMVGAVVGGVAGSAVEEGVTRKTGLEITVRLDNGQLTSVVQEADEVFRAGDRVRLLSGAGGTRVTH